MYNDLFVSKVDNNILTVETQEIYLKTFFSQDPVQPVHFLYIH